MITADTITNKQIRKLREEAWRVYAVACHALGFHTDGSKINYGSRKARSRCADILRVWR